MKKFNIYKIKYADVYSNPYGKQVKHTIVTDDVEKIFNQFGHHNRLRVKCIGIVELI